MAGVPRPVRNHNPGDLKWVASIPWKGLADPPYDAEGFAVYVDDFHGFRALAIDLHSAWAEGYDTIAKLVPHYAPAADDNDVAAYEAAVEKRMGVAADAVVRLADPTVLESAVHAFTHAEYSAAVSDTAALVAAAVAAALNA